MLDQTKALWSSGLLNAADKATVCCILSVLHHVICAVVFQSTIRSSTVVLNAELVAV